MKIIRRQPGSAGTHLAVLRFGISVDSMPCKRAWADSLSITKTRLLCDFWPHGVVVQKYGLFREENGFSERANVIVDENQMVVYVNGISDTFYSGYPGSYYIYQAIGKEKDRTLWKY